jgi:sensor c-di-GMP phosphodiesterase-like protein
LNKSRIIAVTIVLIICCVGISLAAILHFAWVRTVNDEQQRLSFIANSVIMRAALTLEESTIALHTIANQKLLPCSPDQISFMRSMVMDSPTIDEMGYFDHGVLKCTSWGIAPENILQAKPDITTADGIEITFKVKPLVVPEAKTKMALQYKDFNILIVPERIVDVIVDPNIQIALATVQGQLIEVQHEENADLLKTLLTHPANGVVDDYLIVKAENKNFLALVTEPVGDLYQKNHEEQLLLLPLGALLAALMIGLVIWLSRRRLSPVGELTIAVNKHEFIVYYQPIVELKTRRCIGAEALLRWRRPDGTEVSPDYFIPIAEESGLIRPITDQLIHQVLKDLKDFLKQHPDIHVAVNLCADDIKTGRVLPVLQAALKDSGVRPQQIWLEATERGFMDIEAARKTITLARDFGYTVAIDDFGTGYSSLSYLQGFPLDTLKIDKSFVDTIGTDSATSSVTPHIINMAKTFNLKIIAEGVETQAQADYLLEHQVEYGQGWLFAKAMSAEDFIEYCKKHHR